MKLSHRRKFLRLAAGAAALPALSLGARAQTYPTRPISMVVPFPPGGATDSIARVMSEQMRAALGQPMIIENVPGAGGSTGVGRVARASPDGYTLSIGHWSTHVVNGATYPLQYDVLNDFEPISLICTNPQIIVSKNAVPAKDLKELIAWLKANEGKVSVGTVGVGGASHVAGVAFQSTIGSRFNFVPYRGGAPAMQDLVGGQIDLMLVQAADAVPHVSAGRIKGYAVTARARIAALPDLPSVDEAGLPGLHIAVWHALWAPKGAPNAVLAKLNAAVVAALADPSVRQRLAGLGQEIFPREQQTPQALGAFHKAEIEKWWPIIKAASIKGE